MGQQIDTVTAEKLIMMNEKTSLIGLYFGCTGDATGGEIEFQVLFGNTKTPSLNTNKKYNYTIKRICYTSTDHTQLSTTGTFNIFPKVFINGAKWTLCPYGNLRRLYIPVQDTGTYISGEWVGNEILGKFKDITGSGLGFNITHPNTNAETYYLDVILERNLIK